MYRCELKVISRGDGRSAAGTCAYVAASVGVDSYTGAAFDYSRKGGVVDVGFCGTSHRTASDFSAPLDAAEKRCDSRVAREAIVSLPHGVSDETRRQIVAQIADDIHARWGVPVMWALHRAGRGGDVRNEHAHLLFGTRDREGRKVASIEGKQTGPAEVQWLRAQVAQRIQAIVPEQERDQWDHRSYAARGLDIVPMEHEGPQLTALRRRGGRTRPQSERCRRNDQNRAARTAISEAEAAEQAATAQIAALDQERAALRAEAAAVIQPVEEVTPAAPEQLGLMDRLRKVVGFQTKAEVQATIERMRVRAEQSAAEARRRAAEEAQRIAEAEEQAEARRIEEAKLRMAERSRTQPMDPAPPTPAEIRQAIKRDLDQDKGPEPGQTTGGRRR